MFRFQILVARLRAFLRRDAVINDIDEETRSHIELATEANISRGMSPDEARRLALKHFGNPDLIKEISWEVRGGGWLESFWQDLRYGVRQMRKAPGFTLIAVLSLGFGIGANTALFTIFDAVLLRALPVKEPDRLVLFNWQSDRSFRTTGVRGISVGGYPPDMRGSSSFHYRVFEKLRKEVSTRPDSPLATIFAFASLRDLTLLANGQAENIQGQAVSGSYFTGLGVEAVAGRLITEADDNPSAAPVAVLSYEYWQSRFGRDLLIIGKEVKLNQISFTVIGITPPDFTGTLQIDDNPAITVPASFEKTLLGEQSGMEGPSKPGLWWLHVMGRLKPGATLEQARNSLDSAFQSVALELMPPPKKANVPAVLEPKNYPHLVALSGSRGMSEMRSVYSTTIYLLLGVVGLVLAVACANVANLLLARGALRGSEITVRLAVGAGRWRLIRQLLTESILLSAAGGLVGFIFAVWGKDALATLGTQHGDFLPAAVNYSINWRVLAFTTIISLLTGIFFGLAPAWRTTNIDLTTALKDNNHGSGRISRSRISKALVIVQVAMSLTLLIGAGLLVRTLRNLEGVEVGFNQQNLLLFTLRPQANGYKEDRLAQLYQQIFDRLEAIPSIKSATFASGPLIAHYSNNVSLLLPGDSVGSGTEHSTNLQIVRENYFSTMEIPQLRGRPFTSRDDRIAPKVAIISDTLARKYFPNRDPLGQRVGFDAKTAGQIEIIGVVRDVKYNSQREQDEPMIYLPWQQSPEGIGEMFFALRTTSEPSRAAADVRQAVRAVDSNLPLTNVTTQIAQSRETLNSDRIFASLLSFFSLLALFLSAIGLYGVMAFTVAQRTNEIGIRVALGAQPRDVLRLVIWQGMKLVLSGLIVGGLASVALTRVVASQLYGIGANDPVTFAAVVALLILIALLACWVPARRATRVDPLVALRYE